MRVRERLTGLDLDPSTEAEILEELTQHVEDRYRDLIASGTDPDAAESRAWREIEGHPKLAREISGARRAAIPAPIHDQSRNRLAGWWDDLAFAWRRLRYSPGFAIVALLTVTLTVGANTAILSVADAVLFRPLPYADPGNVAVIQVMDRKSGRRATRTDYQFLHAINAACPSVSDVALLESYGGKPRPTLETADGTVALEAMEATPNYFELLGVHPARGRIFSQADAASVGPIAMLSYAAWRDVFGGDESVPGRTVTFGAATFHITGVLPADFVFPSLFASRPALFVMGAPLAPGEKGATFYAIARITSGVSRGRAQAEVEAATAPVSAALPRAADITPVLDDVRGVLYPVGRPIMRYLLAAAVLILLLGCANLANMMLVRGRRRLQDTAVRLALGATRMRIIRPLIFEAFILGIIGAGLAVLVTSVSFDALLRQVPPIAYGRAAVGISARVVMIAIGMGLLCGVAFSIVPAWRASGVDVLGLLQRRAGRGRTSARGRPLLAAQVAVAVAVVFGAAMAARSFLSTLSTPLGFDADNVLRVVVSPGPEVTDRTAYYERIVAALAARSDVAAVGAAGSIPFSNQAPDEGAQLPGAEQPAVGSVHVLPGYLETIRARLRQGRLFTWDDARTDRDVAVVSVSAARTLFQNDDALGAVFTNGRDRTFRVIGVIDDVVNALGDAQLNRPRVYIIPGPRSLLNVMVRIRERREESLAAIKAELRPLSAGAPTAVWWSDQIGRNAAYRDPRFQTIILGGLATIALALTALGIFSVVAYLVAARARELGVRLALGAMPESLVVLVVRQVVTPVVLGLAIGLVLILLLRKLAETQLYKVDTTDPIAATAAGVTVLVAATTAAFLPARRATKINPTEVLRAE